MGAVALLPDETQVNALLRARLMGAADASVYDYEMPQTLLRELFERNAVPVIDLLPVFLADGRCLYNNTTHWNPEGHNLAAQRLAPALLPWFQAKPWARPEIEAAAVGELGAQLTLEAERMCPLVHQ